MSDRFIGPTHHDTSVDRYISPPSLFTEPLGFLRRTQDDIPPPTASSLSVWHPSVRYHDVFPQ